MARWGYRQASDWRQRKANVLKRDQWTCYICGGHATEVDHVVNVASGGTDDYSNLRAICSTDHEIKTRSEQVRGLRRFNGRRLRPTAGHPGDT